MEKKLSKRVHSVPHTVLHAAAVFLWPAFSVASVAMAAPEPDSSLESSSASSVRRVGGVPRWAASAKWYRIDIAVFDNGDTSNDPPGTTAWPAGPSTAGKAARDEAKSSELRYGGDLAGIVRRFPYLKDLGVDTLHLTGLFRSVETATGRVIDLRHIDESVGHQTDPNSYAKETADPASWVFTKSDREFVMFLKRAHAAGFRVIPSAELGGAHRAVGKPGADFGVAWASTRRWMDPNGDGRPDDGVDGWVVEGAGDLTLDSWKRWRLEVKKLNPNALIVGDVRGDEQKLLSAGVFDTIIDYEASAVIRKFLRQTSGQYSPSAMFADLSAIRERVPPESRLVSPLPLSGPLSGRLLTNLADGNASGSAANANLIARWRLATVFQHFYAGVPVTYYGDEMGMRGGKGAASRGPMLWPDRLGAESAALRSRDDFASLIQWLHVRRGVDAPLQGGDFRSVLADGERNLFAFARTLGAVEVVLVMNYGPTKQKVMLAVGRAGQKIGVLSPILDPKRQLLFGKPGARSLDRISPRRMGASSQVVNADGLARLWVDPMSIRVVLVYDE